VAADIFVSYSQPDTACAFDLVQRLEESGFGCWIAPRDIAPAADWAAEIIDAINAARLMILVFSASSNDSAQVRREVERAVHKHLHILPFRIEDVLPAKSLEYFLSAQHWMDAFPAPLEPHYARLVGYLKAHFAPPPSAAPSPGTPPLAGTPLAGTPSPGTLPLKRPPSIDASGTYGVIAAAAPHFTVAELHRLELLLAAHIGPLARHLVKKAAAQAATVDDLIARLTAELDEDADRRHFSLMCARAPQL
jgi:hypothetical protein